jgi:hypothetical protein
MTLSCLFLNENSWFSVDLTLFDRLPSTPDSPPLALLSLFKEEASDLDPEPLDLLALEPCLI